MSPALASQTNFRRHSALSLVLRSMVLILLLSSLSPCASAQKENVRAVEQDGGYIRNVGNPSVIVFIHGLFSGPDAWICPQSGTYWPALIAEDEDPVLKHSDVYVAKYVTPKRGGSMTMADLASSIYNQLAADGVFSRYQNITFVAHSMGGILTQQLLVTYINERLAEKVHTIFLYGTPEEGSELANIDKLFNRDPLLTELEAGEGNLILPELDQRWHHANTTNIKRFCAYETRKEGISKVVDRNSATRNCDDFIAIPVNHRDLVKPCSVKDPAYTFLKRKLDDEAASSPRVISTAPKFGLQQMPGHLQPPTETPYSEVSDVLRDLDLMKDHWWQDLLQVDHQFYEPWKHGGSQEPIPSRLPDTLIDQVRRIDENASRSYEALETRIEKARADARECIQPTPNQAQLDKDTFRSADQLAAGPIPTSILAKPPVESIPRFQNIVGYFDGLKQKLGDYHCVNSEQSKPATEMRTPVTPTGSLPQSPAKLDPDRNLLSRIGSTYGEGERLRKLCLANRAIYPKDQDQYDSWVRDSAAELTEEYGIDVLNKAVFQVSIPTPPNSSLSQNCWTFIGRVNAFELTLREEQDAKGRH